MATPNFNTAILQADNTNIRTCCESDGSKYDAYRAILERRAGLRTTGKRGFDVISNSFFVEETVIDHSLGSSVTHQLYVSFDDFDSYYNFLDGDIYSQACYTFCPHPLLQHSKNWPNIDLSKLFARRSFVEKTIKDYSLACSTEEKQHYQDGSSIHKLCQQWEKKFNACQNYEQLVNVTRNYQRSKLAPIVDVSFFFFQYIFADTNDERRFSIIMQYMSSGVYPEHKITKALCSIYDPDEVIKAYQYFGGSKSTRYKHKRDLKEYVNHLKNGRISFSPRAFFDKTTHYYCEETEGFEKDDPSFPIVKILRSFATFEEFVTYRKGDLTHCDLYHALECHKDLSKYTVDPSTTLPCNLTQNTTSSIKKYYDGRDFYVIQQWYDSSKNLVKAYAHTFPYFFDFVAFLENDLSGADLTFCDGLRFLDNWDSINFSNAKMKSDLCEKFHLQYNVFEVDPALAKALQLVQEEEGKEVSSLSPGQAFGLEPVEHVLLEQNGNNIHPCPRIQYISDIHLIHKILNAHCRSNIDVTYIVQKIADTIAHEACGLLLIAGDVSSDFKIFQLFVEKLAAALNEHITVVFVLGNHELWSFQGFSMDDIVEQYRNYLSQYGMYLLHNDIIYIEGLHAEAHLIKYHELCELTDTQIRNRLRCAQYVLWGGLGFSGYNMNFNANHGIYRETIDRVIEIQESKKFECLYYRLHRILHDKNTVILTHTPKKDWCSIPEYDEHFVYVNGHTHRNFFYDDSVYRIYSDNQVGYCNDYPHLKELSLDNDYDYFSDYDDGIYTITGSEYSNFYRGKNIMMSLSRKINKLYMLKKHGYYCFIHQSKSGSLSIMNGGAMKKVASTDINHYFKNMDTMIATIQRPLEKFTAFQTHIADMVKQIGGVGTIHGSIIDIDFYNHIYVSPFDLSIIGYWASDMINKMIYPSVPALLEEHCPELFRRYSKMLEGSCDNSLLPLQCADPAIPPHLYLNTDIYRASREIRKMQRLYSNILSCWHEEVLPQTHKIELK